MNGDSMQGAPEGSALEIAAARFSLPDGWERTRSIKKLLHWCACLSALSSSWERCALELGAKLEAKEKEVVELQPWRDMFYRDKKEAQEAYRVVEKFWELDFEQDISTWSPLSVCQSLASLVVVVASERSKFRENVTALESDLRALRAELEAAKNRAEGLRVDLGQQAKARELAESVTQQWRGRYGEASEKLEGFTKPPEGSDLPEGFRDKICTASELEFSFLDRLRILIRGRVWFDTWTLTEYRPGKTKRDKARLIVAKVFRRRPELGMVEVAAPHEAKEGKA